jgi:hypothetical protein
MVGENHDCIDDERAFQARLAKRGAKRTDMIDKKR